MASLQHENNSCCIQAAEKVGGKKLYILGFLMKGNNERANWSRCHIFIKTQDFSYESFQSVTWHWKMEYVHNNFNIFIYNCLTQSLIRKTIPNHLTDWKLILMLSEKILFLALKFPCCKNMNQYDFFMLKNSSKCRYQYFIHIKL